MGLKKTGPLIDGRKELRLLAHRLDRRGQYKSSRELYEIIDKYFNFRYNWRSTTRMKKDSSSF